MTGPSRREILMRHLIRPFLFYLGVVVFFLLTPLILLYSFGYKIDLNKLRLTRTGLIYLSSVPDKAKVYLNGFFTKETTPTDLEELMPGEYEVSLEMEGYYPWSQKVRVSSGKTTVLDRIVLFPKKTDIDRFNISEIGDFRVFAHDKDYAYCLSQDKRSIYKVRLNPKDKDIELLAEQLALPDSIQEISLSPHKDKILFYSGNTLEVIYLSRKNTRPQTAYNDFSLTAEYKIMGAFWYSDSEHIVVVTDRDIKIYELASKGRENTVKVMDINDRRPRLYYDNAEDVLYFSDVQQAPDGRIYRGMYRLDLSRRSSIDFIKGLQDNIK